MSTEAAFTVLLALLTSICFVSFPRLLGFIEVAEHHDHLPTWDAPTVFILPFLVFKFGDFAGQVPFRVVENIWFFPLETVSVADWPWRQLVRVNFQVAGSLLEEYRWFGKNTYPWIEVPQEQSLGRIFRLTMQERRKKQGLSTIQDLGNEYAGAPKFWWLFSIKFVWWHPATWSRQPRFLNPDLSIAANKVRPGDIILARRVPADPAMSPSNRPWLSQPNFDSEKTTIIKR